MGYRRGARLRSRPVHRAALPAIIRKWMLPSLQATRDLVGLGRLDRLFAHMVGVSKVHHVLAQIERHQPTWFESIEEHLRYVARAAANVQSRSNGAVFKDK